MRYFDAHGHIQFPQFDTDREELIATMRTREVGGLVVGTELASSRRAVELVQQHDHLWATIGQHPNDTTTFDEAAFRELIVMPKVVGVGECGLDNFRPEDPEKEKSRQRDMFEAHVRLAVEFDKPLVIHARPTKGTADAYQDLIEILSSHKREHGDWLRGDIHFFVGGIEEATKLIDLGFTLSFTAVLTFARDYDNVVRFAPLSMLLSETDAPYIAPASRRGQRNDPLAAIDVVQAIAQIRGEEEELVRATLLANAARVFQIPLTA
jgi:TatD DNase family protein